MHAAPGTGASRSRRAAWRTDTVFADELSGCRRSSTSGACAARGCGPVASAARTRAHPGPRAGPQAHLDERTECRVPIDLCPARGPRATREVIGDGRRTDRSRPRPARGEAARAGRRAGTRRELKLADAQLAVARELGEASWPRLVRRVEAEAVAREDRGAAARGGGDDGRRDHAEALLALDPDLGREGFDAALVLGEAERVRAALARDPGLADAAGRRARLAAAALPMPLRVPGRRAHRRARRVRAGAARRRRRPGLELAAPGVRLARRALRRGGRRPRAADDRAAARGGREPERRRVRLPRDRDRRRHLPAAAARRGRAASRARTRSRTASTPSGPAMLRLLLDHEPGREVERSLLWAIYRGRSPEVLRMLVEPAPTCTRGTRRTSARPTGSRGGWGGRTSASCSPSSARGARSGRSTS